MTVLITGSQGFIGSNMIKYLNNINNINIIEFNKETSWQELEKNIIMVDFIYHFAGEVKQKNSNKEFKKANVCLTKRLITLIEEKKKKIPFLMSSSIHAELQTTAYGISKREAEIYLETYGKYNNIPIWIYRLPHIFGEGCKPNYNSVISTWIYNSIHDKEIIVFDRNTPMTYAYVQDIVKEFVECLKNRHHMRTSCYIKPKISYYTTLGEVIDFLKEFKNLQNNFIPPYTDFKAKLFTTYLDYIKRDDIPNYD